MQRHLSQNLSKMATPQSQQAHPAQQKNEAGGYTFVASNWTRFLRFLILGTEGGTYYLSEKELTLQAGDAMKACCAEDLDRYIALLVDVSLAGRAPKNDPTIFALAYAFGAIKDHDHFAVAEQALLRVCRTGTDILHFCEFVQSQRGWGAALRRAVARWYGTRSRTADQLAYQLIKYRQRDGWSHRDAIRLSHPVSRDPVKRALFALVAGNYDQERYLGALESLRGPRIVDGFLEANATEVGGEAVTRRSEFVLIQLINSFGLTREMLPTEALKLPKVWEALLKQMPIHAMVRNLGNLGKHGLLRQFSAGEKLVLERLNDIDLLQQKRLHPLAVLAALRTYAQGRGFRGNNAWEVNQRIADALDATFVACFHNAEQTNLRVQVAIDVSGSMNMGEVVGIPNLTPREAAAALATVFARREENIYATAFSDRMVPFTLGKRSSMDSVMRQCNDIPMGATDCAQPMLYALEQKIPTDLFLILTDNETWFGRIHPHQALEKYRREMNMPNAKLVTVAMTAAQRSIANPDDPGMLDVVGFDAGIHQLICSFANPERKVASAEVED